MQSGRGGDLGPSAARWTPPEPAFQHPARPTRAPALAGCLGDPATQGSLHEHVVEESALATVKLLAPEPIDGAHERLAFVLARQHVDMCPQCLLCPTAHVRERYRDVRGDGSPSPPHYHGRVQRYDAAVIGAGPAGSVTAIHLARGGARVLLIDKACFPRDKPCGGGLTLRAVRQLPVDPGPVVEHEVDRMEFRLGRRSRFERSGRRGPFVLMTQRRRLDQYLAEQAAEAGAEFRDGVKVGDVEEGRLRVDGEEIAAEIVVGADGANGTAARSLGLGGPITQGVAYEGNAPFEERYRGLAVIELGTIPGGYGWVFPKGDHVNVGVGGWEAEGPRLRGHLAELCRREGIDSTTLESVRGHRLPLRRAGFVPARGRALLVGDAAGLVDPLTGDGMYEAFVSARLAAEAALGVLAGRAETVEPYADRLTDALGSLAGASWGAKIALDRFPRVVFGLARAPLVWPVVERLVRGDISAPGEARGLARPPLKAIAALARIAGARAA